MQGRDLPILAIALGISGVCHLGLYGGARQIPVHALNPGEFRFGRSVGVKLLGDGTVKDDSADIIRDLKPLPDVPAPVEPPEPIDPPKVEPPPPKEMPKPDVEKFPDKVGVFDGTGIGSHKADGDKPMKAENADSDQPFLSRDPRGPGKIGDPSKSTMLPGQNGIGGPPGGALPQEPVVVQPAPPRPAPKMPDAEVGPFRPGPIEVKIPVREDGVDTQAEKIDEKVTERGPLTPARPGVDPNAVDPGPANGGVAEATDIAKPVRSTLDLTPPPPARAAMSPPPAPPLLRLPPAVAAPVVPEAPAIATIQPTPPQEKQGLANTAVPGPATPAADAAQESESEVDPFSKIEAVVRQDGKVDPQFGREVKTVRPKIPIVGMIDAISGARRVTLKVRIGPDGKVQTVHVFKSSGSNEIDQPCLIAMYDWWFEPLKDKRGVPIPDTILFTLNFR